MVCDLENCYRSVLFTGCYVYALNTIGLTHRYVWTGLQILRKFGELKKKMKKLMGHCNLDEI